MRVLPIPRCQLSLWEEIGAPGENPRLSAECWLYSFHMRTGFEPTLLGIELRTLEVKGEWSDHWTTEAQLDYNNDLDGTLAKILAGRSHMHVHM